MDPDLVPDRAGQTKRDWSEAQKRERAARVRKALKEGTLGLGFSAGGFLYGYHLGVLWELTRLKVCWMLQVALKALSMAAVGHLVWVRPGRAVGAHKADGMLRLYVELCQLPPSFLVRYPSAAV